jgi:repressor LexA
MTESQQKVYDCVVEFIADNGYAPTIRQMGEILGYSSTATVQQHLKTLVEKGYLQGAGRTLRPESGAGVGDPSD